MKYIPITLMLSFVIWLIYMADMDHSHAILTAGRSVVYGDKIAHFFLFGSLSLCLNIALDLRKISFVRKEFYLSTAMVFFTCVSEEISQLAFESRTFDLLDILSDVLGIWLFSSRRIVVWSVGILNRIQKIVLQMHLW